MKKSFSAWKKYSRGFFMMLGLFVFSAAAQTALAAISDISLSETHIDENSSVPTAVGTLSTTGGNAPYTYELVSGTGDEDNAYFSVMGDQLMTNFSPDYENPLDTGDTAGNNTYAARVKVSDTETTDTMPGSDYNAAYNNFGGFYNAQNHPNRYAFAALKSDGSITAWGGSSYGGSGAPTDSGYTHINSTRFAFAALKSDGSIDVWGYNSYGGDPLTAPTDSGYEKIYSTYGAFAALKSDGSITAWGHSSYGSTGAPTDSGYVEIYSNKSAFAALKSDGSIAAWGSSSSGGLDGNSPTIYNGYVKIYSTEAAFAALKSDGSILAWGDGGHGGSGAPTDSGYTEIYSTENAFAAMKADGSITAWGTSGNGGSGAPTDSGYTKISAGLYTFAALKSDGTIFAWGNSDGAPFAAGYTDISATQDAFAALKSDGSISTWGISLFGGSGGPTDSGYVKIYSNNTAFAAMKADGSITAWGSFGDGGSGEPTDSGYIEIYSTDSAFAAMKADGSIFAWGDGSYGASGEPTDSGYSIPYGTQSITVPSQEYEKSFIITVDDVAEDVILTDPEPSDITGAITNGDITVDNGTSSATTQVTMQSDVTFNSTNASALFPSNTVITETLGGSFNMENFTISDATVDNGIAAFELGIPGTNLSFSQDVTITLGVGTEYNGQTLSVYSQSAGQTDWTTHGTCTISEGNCTFTTNHATTFVVGGNPAAEPIDLNVEVRDTLTLDCYDTAGTTGDYDVSIGTTTDPGKVTAGIPAVGQSTCTVTTNDDQGYYLTIIDDNAAASAVLTHDDPNTSTTYEISDLTQFPTTTNWSAPTTKGLGFSVINFPDTNLTNNTLDGIWTETGTCPEGAAADTNDYAGVPDTAQTIAAVTQYEANQTTTNICYKVDVPASQASGQYTGSVTYTATSDASSYLN